MSLQRLRVLGGFLLSLVFCIKKRELKGQDLAESRDKMSEIFRRYSDEIRRFLLKRTRSQEDAEDLMQETFYRVQRQANEGHVDHIRGYLYRTARNLVIDQARHRNLGVIDHNVTVDEEDHVHPDLSPEEVVSVRQEYRTLCDAVVRLSPQVRRVVILSKFAQLSYKEIANVMNISPKTVENHLARGMVQCRQHIVAVHGERENKVVELRPKRNATGQRGQS